MITVGAFLLGACAGILFGWSAGAAGMRARYRCGPKFVEYLMKENSSLIEDSLIYFNWAQDIARNHGQSIEKIERDKPEDMSK